MNSRIWKQPGDLGKSINIRVDGSLKSRVVVLDHADIGTFASTEWMLMEPYGELVEGQRARLGVSLLAVERFASESAALRGKP